MLTPEEFPKEYETIAHGIQSAIAFDYNRRFLGESAELIRELKHVRTGLNCLMADLSSFALILVKKGLMTEAEYFDGILEGLQREADRTERQVRDKYNLPETVKFR